MEPSWQRRQVGRPQGILIEKESDRIKIIRRWFSVLYIIVGCFDVLWMGVCFLLGSVIPPGRFPLFQITFWILGLAIGLGLFYVAVAGFVNRTVLEAGRTQILVKHRPLPWIGEQTIDIADVKQLFTVERLANRTRKLVAFFEVPELSYFYDVYILTKNGRRIKFINALDGPEFA